MVQSAQARLHDAEQVASTLPPLLIEANQVAATISFGSHGRRRAGAGDTFWQFRHYTPTDPAQAIDWRQSAKFGPVFVREREWDAAQTGAIWCDTSQSMHFRSAKSLPTKAERAAVITLALATLLLQAGERVKLIDDNPQSTEAASSGRLALMQMALNLERAMHTPETASLPSGAIPLPRHAAAVLISDFFETTEEIERAVAALVGRGLNGHLLQIVDPAEESLPYAGRVRFAGPEEEGTVLIDRTENVREAYTERLADHRTQLAALAERIGWTFAVHRTDQAPHLALTALFNAMANPTW